MTSAMSFIVAFSSTALSSSCSSYVVVGEGGRSISFLNRRPR